MNKIEYLTNYNVTLGQRKYNNSNYIFVNNLEREKETFKIDLLDKYDISKEFGLGTFKKNGTQIIFNLEPIDVIMIKYSKTSSKSNYLVIFFVILIIIIIVVVLFFVVKRYLDKKLTTKYFIESVSKLMGE